MDVVPIVNENDTVSAAVGGLAPHTTQTHTIRHTHAARMACAQWCVSI
jgi:hypothetical protein